MRPPSGDRNERRAERFAARAKALRNRANRRRQDQPLASLAARVDLEEAERLESEVFRRRPADAGTSKLPSPGPPTLERARWRRELVERTSRRRSARQSDPLDLDDAGPSA
jgi:hypothetical protein